MRCWFGVLVLVVACGTKNGAGPDGAGGIGGGAGQAGGGVGGRGGDALGGGGAGISGTAGSGGGGTGIGGTGGATVDASSQDRPGDTSSDAPRPTPKLTWTQMPGTAGLTAYFISGTADGEIWVADRASGYALQIHADGSTSTTTDPKLSTSAHVTGLWVAGPNNAYLSIYANLVLHWDGSGTWTRDIMTGGTVFGSVWGSGPTDVYASGGGGPYHSTGDDKWMLQSIRATTVAGFGPLGGTGPTDIWLAGIYGEIFRSTGDGTWRQETTPQTEGVDQLWVASPNEGYMISEVAIMHRLPSTGRWVAEPNALGINPEGGTDYFRCIWGSGANDVYVGTAMGHLLHSTGDGVWQDEHLAPNVSLYGIWGRSASDVYLGTSDGVYRGVP